MEHSPVLVCGLGTTVNLSGSDVKEIALVDQWVHFAEQEIGNPCQSIMGLVYGFFGPFNREVSTSQTLRPPEGMTHFISEPRQTYGAPDTRSQVP